MTVQLGACPGQVRAADPPAPTPTSHDGETDEPDDTDDTDDTAVLGVDEVRLHDGGFVRGTLVEVIPNEHVVIRVGGSGERRLIPYEEIERIERGKHADDVEPSPPAVQRRPAANEEAPSTDLPTTTERGKPRVHLETARDRQVKLFEVEAEIHSGGPYGPSHGTSYRTVCAAPCGRVVDGASGASFFLGQDIWTASRRFTLDEYTGDLTIRVRPGNKPLRILGAVLLGIGIGTAIGGAVFVAGENTRTTGIGLLASGIVGIAIGTPMLVLGRTRYEMVHEQK